jgi:hypothetical protein
MSLTTQLVILVAAIAILVIAVYLIRRRQRMDREFRTHESPFAVSTEGMKRCPSCGVGNLVTEQWCSACGKRLPS